MSRLTDLTLLDPGTDIVMHPWTAAPVTRNTPGDLAAQHERALAMRVRRFEQQRGSYDDLIDIPRHLAALHRYDDVASIAGQAVRMLTGTLATLAYLAETRSLIPSGERAWAIVAEHEVNAVLQAGDLLAATQHLRSMLGHAPGPRCGRGRGPGHRPRAPPGQLRHRRPAGRHRPSQHPLAA